MSKEPKDVTLEELFPHVTPEFLEETARLGQAVYDKLKPQLEPMHNRQFVTIHVDTGDYAIGKNSSTATRIMRERHPADGRLFTRKIGDEPEYGLAARILTSELTKVQSK